MKTKTIISVIFFTSSMIFGCKNSMNAGINSRYLIAVDEMKIEFHAPSFPYYPNAENRESPRAVSGEVRSGVPSYPKRHLFLSKELGVKNEWLTMGSFNFSVMEYKRPQGYADWNDFSASIFEDSPESLKWDKIEAVNFGMRGVRAHYDSFEFGVPKDRFSRANFVHEGFFFRSAKGSIIGVWFIFNEYEKSESIQWRKRYEELVSEIKAHLEIHKTTGQP